MKRPWFPLPLLSCCFAFFAASPLEAHPGHYHPPEEVDEFGDEAFFAGVAHPFTGLDHLLAALAVGALAWAMGRQQGAATTGVFFAGIAGGYAMGHAGIAVPMLESGLALAVLGAGLMLMLPKQNAFLLQVLALGAIGCWNGNAHGLEAPNEWHGLGLLAGTAVITALGAATMAGLVQLSPRVPRFAGAAVAAAGLVLTVSRFV